MFKAIDKKDNMEANECKDTDKDKNLAGARQVKKNIQDVIDEWWNNNNLTEEQQIKKNKLFPNGKPTADEFLITFMKYAREKPEYKKLQKETEKEKRKRQTIKDVLFIAFIFLLMLLMVFHICITEKNNTNKSSQAEASTSIKDYWW